MSMHHSNHKFKFVKEKNPPEYKKLTLMLNPQHNLKTFLADGLNYTTRRTGHATSRTNTYSVDSNNYKNCNKLLGESGVAVNG
jgi:hypothetical protein